MHAHTCIYTKCCNLRRLCIHLNSTTQNNGRHEQIGSPVSSAVMVKKKIFTITVKSLLRKINKEK